MDKQALDRYLTTEPDNGFIYFVEKIWDAIPEEEISADEYNKYDDFFWFWENKLSLSGNGKCGFPALSFCVQVIKRRYKMLKYLLSQNWIMQEPNLFINPIDTTKHKIEVAFEIAYYNENPFPKNHEKNK